MKNKGLLVFSLLFCYGSLLEAQTVRKLDTTIQIGKVGYRISCNNKKPDENTITIAPVGFENTATTATFTFKGRVTGAEIDDFNNDGYPDMVAYAYTGISGEIGSIIGISSSENKGFMPIMFPDIYNDPKLRVGYKGHDTFRLVEGTLMRSFPIYNPSDAADNPTGGKRVVQYNVVTSPNGRPSFNVLRSYEIK